MIPEPAGAASREPRVALDLRTRQAAIYDTLLHMIVELELEPGRRLVEADLAAHFHVSKTPIREALLRLQADELVQLAPYQGATVTWLSVEEYEELLYIQDSLEQPALPRISERATPRDLAELDRLVKRLEQRRQEHDSRGFFEVGAAIHQRLMGLAGPIRLVRIVMNLMGQTPRRYERAFVHQFDDAWDIELGIMRDRVAGICAHDPAAAAAGVREGRQAMLELVRSRLDLPEIARYLAPSSEIRPRRMTTGRGGAKARVRAAGDRAGSNP